MSSSNVVKVGNLEIGRGIPKICVPIVGTTRAEIIEDAKACAAVLPDLVEWRCDFFYEVNNYDAVREVLAAISDILGDIPILFTFRSLNEGGNKPIAVSDYVNLNLMVSETEYVKLVDVEYFMEPQEMKKLIHSIQKNGKVTVGSHHRFDCTPPASEILSVLKELEGSGADIPKIAVMPKRDADVKNLMLTVNEATCGVIQRPVIAMSMGGIGVKSRVSGELFGSSVTFGCLGKSSAPGQIPVDELRTELESLHKIVENISG